MPDNPAMPLGERLRVWWRCRVLGEHPEPLEYAGLVFPLTTYRCTACNRVVRHVERETGLVYSSREQFLRERYGDD